MNDQKQCTRCNETKDLVEFPKAGAQCLSCRKVWHQEYYLANRDRVRSKGKDWYTSRKATQEQFVASFTGPTFKRPVTNLTGRTFGHLLVLGAYGRLKSDQHGWLCLCKCKRTHIVIGSHLIRGNVTSCGCRGIVPGKCTKCHQIKSLDQFALDNRNRSGRGRFCKACLQAASKKWYQRNGDRVARKWRERYHSSEGFREQRQIKAHKRRAILENRRCDLTAAEWRAIKVAYKHRCAYCGEKKPLTQDHITPISKGGEHTAQNIVPACQSCNSSKGAKLPQVVYQQHLLVSDAASPEVKP